MAHRLTDGESFRHAIRRGRRAGTRTLVVHLDLSGDLTGDLTGNLTDRPARVGLVVSKKVGNAVVRNRVKRRLRHLCRDHLALLGASSSAAVLVIRAQPAAAGASYAQLGCDLAGCLERVTGQGTAPRAAGRVTA